MLVFLSLYLFIFCIKYEPSGDECYDFMIDGELQRLIPVYLQLTRRK